MKIVCIKNIISEYEVFSEMHVSKSQWGLTIGKSYDVIYEGWVYYRIINDDGNQVEYLKNCFEDLYLFRNKVFDKILEE